jgi:DNA polymerase I-like protein with 3'-5' exonuclease and polymerase domains
MVPQVMSTALTLSVPLKVDIKAGNNWGEMG